MKKIRVCSFCGNMRVHGISILEQWMCSECEEKLLYMDVEDSSYQEDKEKIKDIWKTHYLLTKK